MFGVRRLHVLLYRCEHSSYPDGCTQENMQVDSSAWHTMDPCV